MRLSTYKTEHLEWLHERGLTPPSITRQDIVYYGKSSKYAYTLMEDDGAILIVFGVVEFWPGRGEIWAILNQNCKRRYLAMHNAVRNFLTCCELSRIEATVEHDFENGHRALRALGFQVEAGLMRSYYPNGNAAVLYARVK